MRLRLLALLLAACAAVAPVTAAQKDGPRRRNCALCEEAVSEVASISEVQFVHPAMERICRTNKPEVEAICEAIVARVEANGGAYVEQARLDASGRAFANFLCTAWCGGIDGTGGRARAREERVREMQRLRDELKRRRERAMADEL